MTPPAAGTLTSTEADAVEEAALTGHAYGALDAPPVAATFGSDHQGLADRIMVGVFVAVPLLAVLVAVPVAWGWGLGWTDAGASRSVLYARLPRHHGRLPPVLHPRLVQGEPAR